MKNNNENSFQNSYKNTSRLHKSSSSYHPNVVLLNDDNSFFYNNRNKINYYDNIFDDSIISTNKKIKINSLNQTQKSKKTNKFIHNISSESIANDKTKSISNNLYMSSQPSRKSKLIINYKFKKNKMKILLDKKSDNTYITNIRKESILKLKQIINHLKLSSESNNMNITNKNCTKFNSPNYKNEINIKSNRINKCKDNTKNMSKSNSGYIDSKIVDKNKDENKYINEKGSYTNRKKYLYNSMYNKNEKIKNYLHSKRNNKIKSKTNKNINNNNNKNDKIKKSKDIKKPIEILSRDCSIKLLHNNLSSKNINNNYTDNDHKKIFSKKNKNNNHINFTKDSKDKLLNNKNKTKNKSVKLENKTIKNENNINTNKNKIITVNLNNSNFQMKNKRKIKNSIDLITSISPQNYIIKKDNLNQTQIQTQIAFSPNSSFFTKKHENSLSIFSTKNINKKGNYTYREYPKLSIDSSNKFKYNNNLQEMTQESSEINVIVDSMKNQINQFRNNTSYYLNGERNFFCSPDGPEDFHFRFVELCKQNKNYFKNNKNIIIENEKEDIVEYEQYFENPGEEVPYI